MSSNFAAAIGVFKNGKWPSALAFIIGISYGIAGILQLGVSLGLISPIPGFNNFVGGLLLIIVSSVFLTGVQPLSQNKQEGYAFIIVGYILAALLFGLQVLVIFSNALGWILGYEDWLSWNIYNDITPSLWLFLVLMALTLMLWLGGNLREKWKTQPKEMIT